MRWNSAGIAPVRHIRFQPETGLYSLAARIPRERSRPCFVRPRYFFRLLFGRQLHRWNSIARADRRGRAVAFLQCDVKPIVIRKDIGHKKSDYAPTSPR